VKTGRNFRAAALWAAAVALLGMAFFTTQGLHAQSMTLEGQTGGFVTPTAYVVPVAKHQFFSYPAVGYYFIDADKVIGNLHTFSILEGFGNRAELGYTRSVHTEGDSEEFSSLWHYAGMNVFNGKVVAIKDGEGTPLTPALAAGFVVRTGDKFVSGAIGQAMGEPLKSYTNGDVYVVATKTWLHKPVPFIANLGFKATNASILGIGGQATRFQGRMFGGLGLPIPLPFKTAIIPAAGFEQQPPHSVNLSNILVGGGGRLPTTMDYAVRFTQRDNAHFAVGVGVGQVAGTIGETEIVTPEGPEIVPVNLQARSVLGISVGLRY
jgi:hypothetical protein